MEFAGDPVLNVRVFPPGHDVINASRCEGELGGEWNNAQGVASCTTSQFVVEVEQTGFIQTGTSGTNRWRAQIRTTTTTLFEVTDSQRGDVGALGTSETYEQAAEILDQAVSYEVAVCQPGPVIGSNFQNRPLDSPRCLEILEDFIAAEA